MELRMPAGITKRMPMKKARNFKPVGSLNL